MNMTEYELTLLSEELGEVIDECLQAQKRISKLKRFGPDEVMPGQLIDNATRLRDELLDVLICVEFLTVRGLLDPIEREDVAQAYHERKAKIMSNLARSHENNRINL
jgi:NTP pyrophosphatase (non-canonical NTP hydrolase)